MSFFLYRDQGYGLLRQLCDGCFVAAVLLLGAGVLRYVTNQGAFDVLGYGLQSVFHLHVPGASIGNARDQETMETFHPWAKHIVFVNKVEAIFKSVETKIVVFTFGIITVKDDHLSFS